MHKKPPVKIRLSLELTTSTNAALEAMAVQSGSTKSEILRRALALFETASAAWRKGERVCIVDRRGTRVELVGL